MIRGVLEARRSPRINALARMAAALAQQHSRRGLDLQTLLQLRGVFCSRSGRLACGLEPLPAPRRIPRGRRSLQSDPSQLATASATQTLTRNTMEPPTTARRATTLTRLWQRTDAADSIAQFLPTEALPVLPNIAKTFERDHWRLLGALMRRASRGTAAACRSAVLSTLQMTGRDTVHLREDWADQARFDEKWTYICRRGGSSVEYTARVSGRPRVNRFRPEIRHLSGLFDIPGAGDRCCIHRFGARILQLTTKG